ncbi:MAG: folylpolyglutamate synthase/dihydrofolate synthase family protein [Cetobacterium sp.]
MDINQLLDELYSYSMHGIKLGLSNIEKLCEEMGNPEKDYKVIHVGGTNGKGSTSTTIETVLIENGNSVGKYTSPHILKFNERIRVNGEDISDSEIAYYYKIVKEAVNKIGITPTFFEVTTAMMFKYFSDKKIEYAIVEVGLGGKYDATNVVLPEMVVITNVSLDHTEFLGNNVYEISKEKAGIIKNGAAVVVSSLDLDFITAIEEKTTDYVNVLSKYSESKYELDFKNFITEITLEKEKYEFSLFGGYQYNNFLCAYEVLKKLSVPNSIIKSGIKKVVWPCRFEVLKTEEEITVLDGAHNFDGVSKLKEILKDGYESDEVVTIVSILKDKDINKMAPVIESFSNNIILTSLEENKRGMTGEELAKSFVSKNIIIENKISKAYELAKSMNKKVIVLCGSFYLLSKFKEEIFNG